MGKEQNGPIFESMKKNRKSPKVEDLQLPSERDEKLDNLKGGVDPRSPDPVPIPYPIVTKRS